MTSGRTEQASERTHELFNEAGTFGSRAHTLGGTASPPNSCPPRHVNGALFGNRVFAGVLQSRGDHTQLGWAISTLQPRQDVTLIQ